MFQVASAGAFLGFATLGFALAALGSTTAIEMHHCASTPPLVGLRLRLLASTSDAPLTGALATAPLVFWTLGPW